MDRWKSRGGKSQRREEKRRRKRKSQKKEDPGARKGRKVAKHSVFPMFCGSGRLKSRLAKAAGAEPSGEMRGEKLYASVARSTFPSQNAKNRTPHVRSTCGTFWSQNVRSTAFSEHFRKLRCWKSACLFWTFRCRFAWQARGIVHLVKSEQNYGFVIVPKTMASVRNLKRDLQRCILRGTRGTRNIFIRDMLGS